VLLGVQANVQGWDGDQLLADANVTLADEDTGVVDGLGQTELEDLGLKTAVQEVLWLETEHVVELQLGLVEDAVANQTTEESVALEEALGVLLVQGEKLTSSLADLGQGVLDTPDLTLVLQAVLANELELLVETLLLEWTAWSLGGLRENLWNWAHG